jgi:predicted AAA+ superfamily ATPase
MRGVRQCGKTWSLKAFGAAAYENTVYVNFDETPQAADFFAASKTPSRIVENLSISAKQPILPGKTLLIFDEIQECPDALGSLKYFQENAPEYHVACAGSLLGIKVDGGKPFPVGKVDFLPVFPMTFSEFLMATGEEALANYLDGVDRIEQIPLPFFSLLNEKMKLYFVTGGMPEAVAGWAEHRDSAGVDTTLRNILFAYDVDFIKHLEAASAQRVVRVWNSLPQQLAKENKKFRYMLVKEGVGARDYEEAIDWLTDVSLAHRVNRIKAPGLPLSAYEDERAFKLYAADVGLLRRLSALDPSAYGEGWRLFTEFKGALAENYILQSLTASYESRLRYWTTYNPAYEVDFVLQHKNDVIPVEVKSGKDSKGKGLAVYREKYPDKTRLRVRFSLLNLDLSDDLLNIPLFMADHSKRLIDIALAGMQV